MEGGTGRGCSIYACLALSQDFRRCEPAPNAAAKGPPGLPPKSGACKVTSLPTQPLPDCRRPWRRPSWVETSSWEDQAFFRRSGL